MKKTLSLIYTQDEAEYLAQVGRERRKSSGRRKFPTAKAVLHAVLMRAGLVKPIDPDEIPPEVDAPDEEPLLPDVIPAKNPPTLPPRPSKPDAQPGRGKPRAKRRDETVSKAALPILLAEAGRLGVAVRRVLRGYLHRAMDQAHPAE